jgi:hypothetical protein
LQLQILSQQQGFTIEPTIKICSKIGIFKQQQQQPQKLFFEQQRLYLHGSQ